MTLLATDVLSELMKPTPTERVTRWIAAQPATSLYTTSITQGEILHDSLPLLHALRVPSQLRPEQMILPCPERTCDPNRIPDPVETL